MVVPADHMRDPHLGVVGGHGQVVGRRAVGTEDHEILDIVVAESPSPVDEVVPGGLPGRHAEADRVRLGALGAALHLARVESIRPKPRIAAHLVGTLLSDGAKLVWRDKVPVREPAGEKRLSIRTVAPDPLALEEGTLIPVETQPLEPLEDPLYHRRGRALPIGVLDPENERPARVSGEEPVEERRARPAYVEVARGRGSKTYAGRHGRRPAD